MKNDKKSTSFNEFPLANTYLVQLFISHAATEFVPSFHVFIRQVHVTSAIFSNIILMWCDKLSRVVEEESLI